MVTAAQVDGVRVHAAVVGPVVGQGENQLHAGGFGSLDDILENRQVNSDGAVILEPLGDTVLGARVVLRDAAGNVGAVVVVEGPGTNDLQAGINGRLHADLDVLGVVISPLKSVSVVPSISRGYG